jgi:ABC-type Fe3+-hydroxamate transport system substrate-binding protein
MPLVINKLASVLPITLIALVALLGMVAPAHAAETASTSARAVTVTYLKSQPGKLPELERFVRANWFAMDELAVRQGLFVSYEWLDTGDDSSPWNALVTVTYADEKGFEGIAERWAPIKTAHVEVRPDSLGMKDLGQVLETKTLFERVPFMSKRAMSSPGPLGAHAN